MPVLDWLALALHPAVGGVVVQEFLGVAVEVVLGPVGLDLGV